MARVLVVDDDDSICLAFRQFLKEAGHDPLIAGSAAEALREVESGRPDVVFLDIRMPGIDGVEALRRMREIDTEVPVVMMTAYGTSETSIEAMRLGAVDYLAKPLDLDLVRSVLDKVLEARRLSREIVANDSGDGPTTHTQLAGKTQKMLEAYKLIGLLATNDLPVLVIGERGVGKELVCRTIHSSGPRKSRAFIPIHCRDFEAPELEVELFGRRSTRPDGTVEALPGKLEAATGGTVFLQHVEVLPLAIQTRLARLLADGSFERPGSSDTIRVDARLMTATERDLVAEVTAGTFSEALFEKLRVLPIEVPALRDRREDIPELVSHLLGRCNAELGKSLKGVDDQALRVLAAHGWPGNVGGLVHVIRRAAVLARSDVLTADDLRSGLDSEAPPRREEIESALETAVRQALHQKLGEPDREASASSYHQIVDKVERTLVREALAITSGNQLRAADMLGLNRATLRKRMQETDG